MILPNHLRNSSPWLSEFSRFFESGLRHVAAIPPGFRVYEDDDGWTLELDYPGTVKTDIAIKIEDSALLVQDTREGAHRPSYRLPLGEQIDREEIKASLDLGILKLRLPKRRTDHKTIEIL
jgi:HSP20 family molecular chaperone IbpA